MRIQSAGGSQNCVRRNLRSGMQVGSPIRGYGRLYTVEQFGTRGAKIGAAGGRRGGRQGRGGRTHLVSPQVAAATAVVGKLAAPADL